MAQTNKNNYSPNIYRYINKQYTANINQSLEYKYTIKT